MIKCLSERIFTFERASVILFVHEIYFLQQWNHLDLKQNLMACVVMHIYKKEQEQSAKQG